MDKAISIVIPLRVDSEERKKNLHCVLNQLMQMDFVYIDILEADKEQHFYVESKDRVRYFFIYDEDDVFYRTRYLNILLRKAICPIVGIWDTDVIVPEYQIRQAVNYVKMGCVLCYPYDGDFRFLSKEESISTRKSIHAINSSSGKRMLGRPSVGGAFVLNKDKYIEIGGENEGFYGWGYEDVERYKRLEILEYPIGRIDGPLYHLYHERNTKMEHAHQKRIMQNMKVLLETCRMNKYELEETIKRWKRINK